MHIRKIELDPGGRLDDDVLLQLIKDFLVRDQPKFDVEECYYFGENKKIKSRKAPGNRDVPDNRIPVSYGRKIIKTISGYMYKPGAITYEYENTGDEEILSAIYKNNNEDIHNNLIGTYMSTNGIVYELHYIDPVDENELNYKFTMLKAADGFPVFDYSIDPKMLLFVRLFSMEAEQRYEVYYPDVIIEYRLNKNKNKLEIINESTNVFGVVPIVMYKNNMSYVSDITPINELIDANDALMSDSMNEFERFAFAYLLLVGQSLTNEDAKEIKVKRMFENLENKDAVGFLTKDIPKEFIEFMSAWIKDEIHEQSFIPDITQLKFSGGASGVAISKFIYLMEYIAGDKEAFMRLGLDQRLEIINRINTINDIQGIKITFTRNLPSSDLENAEVYTKYFGKKISTETLIGKYAPFVDNPEEEIEKWKEEEAETVDFETVDDEPIPVEEPEEDEMTESA